MRKGTVRVLDSWLLPPRRRPARLVNRYFAIARCEGQWQLVHRLSGVHTWYQERKLLRDLVALARAATKQFTRGVLDERDPRRLIDGLRAEGSPAWSDAFWAQRKGRHDQASG